MPEKNQTEDKRTEAQKREARLQNLEEILTNEFNQDVIGFSTLKREPHRFGELGDQLGQQGYAGIMNSKEAQKIYSLESELDKNLGLSEKPSASYYVEKNVRQMVRGEAFQSLPLERLAETVKSVVPDFEFELDEDVKNYVPRDFMVKAAMKQKNGIELSEQETYAANVHNYLLNAYEEYLALSRQNKEYVKGLNAQGKALNQNYARATGKLKEDKKEEKAEKAEEKGE